MSTEFTVANRRGAPGARVYGLSFAGLVAAQREHFLRITMTAQRNARRRRDHDR
jgi:c-di-GMP-binding flagellar brake protein YcgR